MNTGIAIAGAAVAVLGIVLLTRQAGGSPGAGTCFHAAKDRRYYVIWEGSTVNLPEAFGAAAWDVIRIVEFYDQDEQDWVVPGDPTNTLIHYGETIRFKVQEPVEVCGFRKD